MKQLEREVWAKDFSLVHDWKLTKHFYLFITVCNRVVVGPQIVDFHSLKYDATLSINLR
jgi:hypothetical protein